MGVRRFADAEDARRALLSFPTEPDLTRRIRSLWSRAARWAPNEPARGVKRFRNIAEVNSDRDRATTERVRRLRAQRRAH
ncbi:MAG: hypothetical protein ACRDKJ_01560 [Actinomycetota bacterium]